MSPDRTVSISSSDPVEMMFFTLDMFLAEMPDSSDSSSLVFTPSGFGKFAKGWGLMPPVLVTKFNFALAAINGSACSAISAR